MTSWIRGSADGIAEGSDDGRLVGDGVMISSLPKIVRSHPSS